MSVGVRLQALLDVLAGLAAVAGPRLVGLSDHHHPIRIVDLGSGLVLGLAVLEGDLLGGHLLHQSLLHHVVLARPLDVLHQGAEIGIALAEEIVSEAILDAVVLQAGQDGGVVGFECPERSA